MAGQESHIPVIPQSCASKKAAGRIRKSPLDREIPWAGRAFSVEVKRAERIMLSPVKGMEVK